MKLAARVAKLKTKRTVIVLLLALVVAGLLTWHFEKKPQQNTASQSEFSLTNSQLSASQQQAAKDAINAQNYSAAATDFMGWAASAGNDKKAMQIYVQATQQIPEQYIPWYLYSNLANLAKKFNNKSLEKDSLQKALAKAQAPDAGATPYIINSFKTRLKALGS